MDPKLIKKLERQKIAIIVLSVILSAFVATLVIIQVINLISQKSDISIYFSGYHMQSPSMLQYNELEITCKKDMILKVSDFAYKTSEKGDNAYTRANGLICNDKEYGPDESFIIYANKINKVVIHGSIMTDNNSIIYYNFHKINLHDKISVYVD